MLLDIQPFLSYARTEFLYPPKDGRKYFSDAIIFAISVRKGELLRFSIMVDGASIISNVLVAALSNDKEAPKPSEEDACFEVCSDSNAQMHTHEYLFELGQCLVADKEGTFYQSGNYVCTIDFPSTGQQLHLIELDNGNYVVRSNEYLDWSKDDD